MRTYDDNSWLCDDQGRRSLKFTPTDSAYGPALPPWSCFCILRINETADSDQEDLGDDERGFAAHKECKVCDGRGFMPIPPGELT